MSKHTKQDRTQQRSAGTAPTQHAPVAPPPVASKTPSAPVSGKNRDDIINALLSQRVGDRPSKLTKEQRDGLSKTQKIDRVRVVRSFKQRLATAALVYDLYPNSLDDTTPEVAVAEALRMYDHVHSKFIVQRRGSKAAGVSWKPILERIIGKDEVALLKVRKDLLAAGAGKQRVYGILKQAQERGWVEVFTTTVEVGASRIEIEMIRLPK